jgi:hypothetical protein
MFDKALQHLHHLVNPTDTQQGNPFLSNFSTSTLVLTPPEVQINNLSLFCAN